MSRMMPIEVPEELADTAARLARERHTSVAAVLQGAIDRELEEENDPELLHREKLSTEEAREVIARLSGVLVGSELEGMSMKDIRQMRLDEKYPRDTPPNADDSNPTT